MKVEGDYMWPEPGDIWRCKDEDFAMRWRENEKVIVKHVWYNGVQRVYGIYHPPMTYVRFLNGIGVEEVSDISCFRNLYEPVA